MDQHSEYVQNGFDRSIERCIFVAIAIASIELRFKDCRYETDDLFVGQMLMAFLVASHIVQHVDYLFLL